LGSLGKDFRLGEFTLGGEGLGKDFRLGELTLGEVR